jgi:hypothetical protein
MTSTMDLGLAALASDDSGAGVLGAMGAVALGVAGLAMCYRVEADDGESLIVDAADARDARTVFWAYRMRVTKNPAPRFFKNIVPVKAELVTDWWVQDAPGLTPRHVRAGEKAAAAEWVPPTEGTITVYDTAAEAEAARRAKEGRPYGSAPAAPVPQDIYAGLEWRLSGPPTELTQAEISHIEARERLRR